MFPRGQLLGIKKPEEITAVDSKVRGQIAETFRPRITY